MKEIIKHKTICYASTKGYISAYYIYLFMQLSLIASAILLNSNYYLKTSKNMAEANIRLAYEIRVLNYFKSIDIIEEEGLINDDLISGTYEKSSSHINVIIEEPINEYMEIVLNEDGTIYDYSSYY